jgi:hypothetical protein
MACTIRPSGPSFKAAVLGSSGRRAARAPASARSDAYRDAALDLVLVGEAVHHAAAVVRGEEAGEADLARPGVDLDLGEVRGERQAEPGRVGAAAPDRQDHLSPYPGLPGAW